MVKDECESIESIHNEFEIMGLQRIQDCEKTGPSRRTRTKLISIVSILLVVIGMASLINSTKSNQDSVLSSASQIKSLRNRVSTLVIIKSFEGTGDLKLVS